MLKKRIQTLIDLIKNTEIEEIEISSFWGAQKIRLSKNKPSNSAVQVPSKPTAVETSVSNIAIDDPKPLSEGANKIEADKIEKKPLDNTEESDNKVVEDINCHEIKAPLVGTFYSSPKPSDPPFVNVGDKITKGQVICIIEAMKIFNDIESEVNGIIHEVCVKDGSPVDQIVGSQPKSNIESRIKEIL